MQVEVANPAHKNTKLGALRIGQVVKKQINLMNNSPSPITFQLNCTPTTPELQDRSVLKISPSQQISLPARGGTCKVDVVFSPKSRIQQFAEEVSGTEDNYPPVDHAKTYALGSTGLDWTKD